ncbi:D-ribitol-5-phosphate cytidylyltransferase-like isoform X2 [Rhodnius prolixus]|uniref:D-ribitol-5-phosphate cytidylyltransferase-like isoform X2 n=1 Tax=Rhodnius prolixus TaxID=13249 RepID=UPI003D1890C0
MVDFEVGVVLPAAGCGERMGSSVPKQYIKILKKPLFIYALEEFLSIRYVKKISLVVDNIEMTTDILKEFGLADSQKVSVVFGDKTRHRSIKAGLLELQRHYQESDIKVVVVHDAVRPFVPRSLLGELVRSAAEVGAAGPVRPLVSTVVKPGNDSCLDASLQRSAYAASETPQAFQFEILMSAYAKCTEEELDLGTECLQLVLTHCGLRPKLITSSDDLWKVTYNKDIYIVEATIREKSTDVCIITDFESDALNLLEDALKNKVASVKIVLGTSSSKNQDNGKKYNTVILLHRHEIQQDLHLVDFANLIDLDKQGLIIHIIDHASIDGMQSMSVYNLHRNSRKMAHHYEKLHKGVVVIHCVSSNEAQKCCL